MYCGFPQFPPLFTEEEKPISGQRKKPTEEKQEERLVLICARDAYRAWWIDKYTTKDAGIYETPGMKPELREYWDLLAEQNAENPTFDEFFLFEAKIDRAIKTLKAK